MAINKKTQAEQAKQFTQLLKDFGITGTSLELTAKDRKKLDKLFPD